MWEPKCCVQHVTREEQFRTACEITEDQVFHCRHLFSYYRAQCDPDCLRKQNQRVASMAQAQAQVLANGQPLEWAQWENRTRCYYSNYIENCQAKHKLIVGNTIAILHFMPGGISGAWETQVECGNVADR